jgi:hypothetical protein
MTTADFPTLADHLCRWDGRRRRAELLLWLPRGLLAGLLLALAVALLGRARPLLTRGELALVVAALALVALAVVALAVLLRQRSLAERARFADQQFGLRERMIAAVEIEAGQLVVGDDLAAWQLRDALAAAGVVDVERQMPLRARPPDWLPALAALALLAFLLWLPNPQEAVLLERRAVAEIVEEQAQALAALSAEIATNDNLTAEQQTALQRPLDEALAALAEPNPSREEVMAALSGAEAELRSLSREFDAATSAEALAKAAASLSESEAASELAEALAAGELAQASMAAGQLADALDDLTDEERADLAERLAETAAALAEADPELAGSLERAADALAGGEIAAAQQALAETEAALGARAGAASAAGRAQSAADQLDAARSAVAQSGAPAAGEGAGEGSPGEGAGGESPETTDGGATAGGGSQQGDVGGATEGGGHVENVFVPPSADLSGEGENVELNAQCLDDPAACGPVVGQSPSPLEEGAAGQVPYDRVFGDYRDAAFEALSSGDIPLSLQALVREYFTALEP